MRRLAAIALLTAAALGASGCLEEEIEITLKADGSGTIAGKTTLSDRITVLSEALGEGLGGALPFPIPVDVTKMMGSGQREALEKSLASLDSFESQPGEDGAESYTYRGTFKSLEFFASDWAKDQVALQRQSDKELVLAANLLGAAEEAGPGPDMASQTGGAELGLLYAMLKGYRKKITVHLPAAAAKADGALEDGGKTVIWDLDLRNRAAYQTSKAMFAKMTSPRGAAIVPASAFKAAGGAVAKLPMATPAGAAEEAPKPDEAAPAKKPAAGGKVSIEAVALKCELTQPLDGSDATTDGLQLVLRLDAPASSPIVSADSPQLTEAKDDLGADLVAQSEGSFTFFSGGEADQAICAVPAPGFGASALVGVKGEIAVTRAAGIETVTLPVKELAALAGKDATGNKTLDGVRLRIVSVDGGDLELAYGDPDAFDTPDPIRSVVLVGADGAAIEPWSSSGFSSSYTVNFESAIADAKSIRIELATGLAKETIPFAFDRLPLPKAWGQSAGK